MSNDPEQVYAKVKKGFQERKSPTQEGALQEELKAAALKVADAYDKMKRAGTEGFAVDRLTKTYQTTLAELREVGMRAYPQYNSKGPPHIRKFLGGKFNEAMNGVIDEVAPVSEQQFVFYTGLHQVYESAPEIARSNKRMKAIAVNDEMRKAAAQVAREYDILVSAQAKAKTLPASAGRSIQASFGVTYQRALQTLHNAALQENPDYKVSQDMPWVKKESIAHKFNEAMNDLIREEAGKASHHTNCHSVFCPGKDPP